VGKIQNMTEGGLEKIDGLIVGGFQDGVHGSGGII
jgi:hypothetical protein